MIIKATPSANTIEKLYLNLEKYPDLDILVSVQNAIRVNGYISVEVQCNHCEYTTQHNLQSLVERRYVCTGCSIKRYKEIKPSR
jgi:transposase-like protein